MHHIINLLSVFINSGLKAEEVNKALKDMKADGTTVKIPKKWFGEDVSPKWHSPRS